MKAIRPGHRVLVSVSTGVHGRGHVAQLPEGESVYWTVVMEDGTSRLTTAGEILLILPVDDSPEALEEWLGQRVDAGDKTGDIRGTSGTI